MSVERGDKTASKENNFCSSSVNKYLQGKCVCISQPEKGCCSNQSSNKLRESGTVLAVRLAKKDGNLQILSKHSLQV